MAQPPIKVRTKSRTFEMSGAWRNCAHKTRRDNPQCQSIAENGRQCTRESSMVHHLVSPDVCWDKRMDPANLVALCDKCHPRTTGDPGGKRYAPTVSNIMGVTRVFPHALPTPMPAGKIAPTGTPGMQLFTSTSQGDVVLDAALGDVAALLEGM
jgi:hypothetical protein